jgi:hypothetical protein
MPRTSPLLLFLALTAVLALPALPVPTAKGAADDWTVALGDRPELDTPLLQPPR